MCGAWNDDSYRKSPENALLLVLAKRGQRPLILGKKVIEELTPGIDRT